MTSLKERSKARKRKALIRKGIIAGVCLLAVVLIACGITAVAKGAKARKQAREAEASKVVYEEKDITIGATGCMLLHSPFLDYYVDEEGNYDFDPVYRYIRDYYSAPDYMTCEMEGSIAVEPGNISGHPNFRYPEIFLKNIMDAGIDLQMAASNHICDGWNEGVFCTMESYKKQNIPYTGLMETEDSKRYYIADVEGIKIGYVNYTYGSREDFNSIELDEEILPYINMMDTDNLPKFYGEMAQTIANMKAEGADYIVANIHWGLEYILEESETQDRIAQKLCDMGVDAIIGGHPHCVQPIDYLTAEDGSHGTFVIYSTGNALSNQRSELMEDMPTGHTEDGVMVTMTLHRDLEGQVTLKNVDLMPTWVYKKITLADGSVQPQQAVDAEGIYTGEAVVAADQTGGEISADTEQTYGSEAAVSNVEYWILPLDDVEQLEAQTGLTGIHDQAAASYKRTMDVLKPGLDRVKEALGAV